MNASSLYVTVLRLVFQNDATNVYRLFPYLRQSLSCSVCGQLLQEPFSPLNSPCQHHECKACIGGRKILKPSCSWCRDRQDTVQNVQLRLLLQCYKSLCEYIKLTPIYDGMQSQVQVNTSNNQSGHGNSGGASGSSGAGDSGPTNRLADFVDEGIRFNDEFKSTAGLAKATYSMLPCLYQPVAIPPPATPTSPQPVQATPQLLVQQQHQQQQPQHLNVPLVLPSQTLGQQEALQQISSNLMPRATTSHVLLKSYPGTGQRTLIHTMAGSQLQKTNSNNSVKQMHIPASIATVTTIGGGQPVHANGGTSVYVTKANATVPPMPIIKTVSNGSALYSVMYAGSGNKITIKRKTDSATASNTTASSISSALASQVQQQQQQSSAGSGTSGGGDQCDSSMVEMRSSPSASATGQSLYTNQLNNQSAIANYASGHDANGGAGGSLGGGAGGLAFKKPPMVVRSKALAKRKGCRCGNATLTPGKLTCCGQRCPCYVESKPCIDCKCRGCRNPHRPDGFKVRPHIPELENLDFHLNAAEMQQQQTQGPILKVVMSTLNGISAGGGGGVTANGMEVDGETGYMFSGNGSGLGNSSRSAEGTSRLAPEVERKVTTPTNTTAGDVNLFQNTSRAANVPPPGKIQVLYTTTPSSIGSGLPTIIMGTANNGHRSITTSSSNTNNTVTLTQMQQLQQALGSSSSTSTAYNFMSVPPSVGTRGETTYLTTTTTGGGGGGGGLINPGSSSATTTTPTFNLTGAHNVSFQSLFGDCLPTTTTTTEMATELATDALTEEELAGGVILGPFGTDGEEEDDDELQLNGETVDLAMDSTEDEEGEDVESGNSDPELDV